MVEAEAVPPQNPSFSQLFLWLGEVVVPLKERWKNRIPYTQIIQNIYIYINIMNDVRIINIYICVYIDLSC